MSVSHLFRQISTQELHTDANSHGLGTILLQKADGRKFHCIRYNDKKSTPQQEKNRSCEM